jgi:hypothetical protein
MPPRRGGQVGRASRLAALRIRDPEHAVRLHGVDRLWAQLPKLRIVADEELNELEVVARGGRDPKLLRISGRALRTAARPAGSRSFRARSTTKQRLRRLHPPGAHPRSRGGGILSWESF